jgi:hypothetical protein
MSTHKAESNRRLEVTIMRSFITHFSPNIIRMIKSRRVRKVEGVVCMTETINAYKIFVRNP